CFFFSSRRRHTRFSRDWSSDVCSSDLATSARCSTSRGRPFSPSWLGALIGIGAFLSRARPPQQLDQAASRKRFNAAQPQTPGTRSEERRVGKECRAGRTGRQKEKKTGQ